MEQYLEDPIGFICDENAEIDPRYKAPINDQLKMKMTKDWNFKEKMDFVITNMQKEIDQTKNALAEVTTEQTQLQAFLDAAKREKNELKEKLEETSAELTQVRENLENANALLQDSVTKLQESENVLQVEVETLKLKLVSNREELEARQASLEEANVKIEMLEEENTTLKNESKEAEERLKIAVQAVILVTPEKMKKNIYKEIKSDKDGRTPSLTGIIQGKLGNVPAERLNLRCRKRRNASGSSAPPLDLEGSSASPRKKGRGRPPKLTPRPPPLTRIMQVPSIVVPTQSSAATGVGRAGPEEYGRGAPENDIMQGPEGEADPRWYAAQTGGEVEPGSSLQAHASARMHLHGQLDPAE